MTQGYYAGITGIQTNQYGLDVISDNLANTGTVGYKSSSTEFADLFTRMIGTAESGTPTSNTIGYGTKLQATSFNFAQGEITPSDRYSDLAIEGDGWFKVVSGKDAYFTRDGHFTFDAYEKNAGDVNSSVTRLTTPSGMYVAGTILNNFTYNSTFDYGDLATNNVSGAYVISTATNEADLGSADSQTMIELPARLAYPVEPTTQASFYGNLGLEETTRTISADIISASDQRNRLKLTFTQSAVQPAEGVSWDVVATVMSADGTTVYDTKTGQAIFSASGGMNSFTIPSVNNNGTAVSINLGSDFSGVISTDGISVSGASSADGISGGTLTKYGINANGVIVADFSNGRQSAIGRIAIYHFQNNQGLNREGGTYYTESADSGKPIFWSDSSGKAITGSVIRSGALEASNVRTDVSLTDMIITQRAYQASAKSITTVDEMIQKALQMHR